MYRTLISVVGNGCLAKACFYLFLPDELRGEEVIAGPGSLVRMTSSEQELNNPESPARRTRNMLGNSRGQSARGFRLNRDGEMDGDSDGEPGGGEEYDAVPEAIPQGHAKLSAPAHGPYAEEKALPHCLDLPVPVGAQCSCCR